MGSQQPLTKLFGTIRYHTLLRTWSNEAGAVAVALPLLLQVKPYLKTPHKPRRRVVVSRVDRLACPWDFGIA